MTNEEKKAYECYMDRLSMPMHPRKVSVEERDAYNSSHPLPSEDEIQRVLKEAGC